MYDFTVTTNPNVTKASPTRTALQLRPGVITLVHVAFPPGPQGLLHVAIEWAGSLLWPENEGQGFAWDDYTLIFQPLLELPRARSSLTAVTWNEDDTFSHQVNLRFQVTPPELVLPDMRQLSILQQIHRRLFGGRA